MKILITGGSGKIGSALAAELSKKHEVSCLDLKEPEKRIKNVEYFVGDIADSLTWLKIGKDYQWIVNCANEPDSNSDNLYRTNVNGTILALFFASRVGAKFLFLSSIYCDSDYSKWCLSKKDGEKWVREYRQKLPDIAILRIGDVFGKGFDSNIDKIKAKQRIKKSGKGSQLRNYISIKDVILVVFDILKKDDVRIEYKRVFYNALTGNNYSTAKLIEEFGAEFEQLPQDLSDFVFIPSAIKEYSVNLPKAESIKDYVSKAKRVKLEKNIEP